MLLAYIIQSNMICVAVCLIIYLTMLRGTIATDARQRTFRQILIGAMIICLSDMCAVPLSGTLFAGSRFLLYLTNDLYYLALCFVDYLWLVYVMRRLGRLDSKNPRQLALLATPMLIFVILLLLSSFTGFVFKIDAANEYSRGPGVYLHWFVSWGYMIAATLMTFDAYRREESRVRRSELMPLLYFMIAPSIAAIVQMLCFGLSTIQVGITLSILIIYVTENNALILTDPLTGLNNRRNMDLFLNDSLQRGAKPELTMVMADLNHFKQVNDTYGHTTGDRMICLAATALKKACGRVGGRLFLCRYGGDEFVIIGRDLKPADIILLPKIIHDEIAKVGAGSTLPADIGITVGMATGVCRSLREADALLREADSHMYGEKKRLKGE